MGSTASTNSGSGDATSPSASDGKKPDERARLAGPDMDENAAADASLPLILHMHQIKLDTKFVARGDKGGNNNRGKKI